MVATVSQLTPLAVKLAVRTGRWENQIIVYTASEGALDWEGPGLAG